MNKRLRISVDFEINSTDNQAELMLKEKIANLLHRELDVMGLHGRHDALDQVTAWYQPQTVYIPTSGEILTVLVLKREEI